MEVSLGVWVINWHLPECRAAQQILVWPSSEAPARALMAQRCSNPD